MNDQAMVTYKHGTPRWNTEVVESFARYPIMVKRYDERPNGTTWHNQPGIELHVTHEGQGALIVGDRILVLKPRQVVMFRGDMPHQLVSVTTCIRTLICIDDVWLLRQAGEAPGLAKFAEGSRSFYDFQLLTDAYHRVEQLITQLHDELVYRRTGWQQMSLARILEITVVLQRFAEDAAAQSSGSEAAYDGQTSRLVQACSDYVRSNLQEDLSLRLMAVKFGMSPEHLSRCFKRTLGVNYHQFVLQQRIGESKRLLESFTDLTMTDIAFASGFESASHFSRAFRSMTKEAPSVYRKRLVQSRMPLNSFTE